MLPAVAVRLVHDDNVWHLSRFIPNSACGTSLCALVDVPGIMRCGPGGRKCYPRSR